MTKSVFSDAHATLVAALIELRTEQGVSQVTLAQRLGRSQQVISQIERGDRRVDVIEFCVIAKALDREPGTFLSEIFPDFPNDVSI